MNTRPLNNLDIRAHWSELDTFQSMQTLFLVLNLVIGCRKGYQALEVISVLRWLSERHSEWKVPLFVGKLDFKGAFGSLSHPSLETALQRCGVHEKYVLAIMGEIFDNKVSFKFLGIAWDHVLLLNGVAQGDPASPLLFTATVDRLLRPLVDKWKRMGRGLQLDLDDGSTVHLPLLAWMDDVYVLAPSPDELQSLIREICLATAPAGLKLQPEKCMWSTNMDSCTAELSVQGLPLQRVPSSAGLEVLGTLVCLNGDTGPELDARVTKAWRAFWANAPFLLNPTVHPHRRLKLLESIVTPCVLWGAGAFTATAQQL